MGIKNTLLRPNGTALRFVLLLSGTGAAQLITLLGTLILARLYSPAQYGEYALFLSISSLLAVAATGRYEFAILLPETKKEIIDLLVLIALILAGCSFVILLGVRAFIGNLSQVFFLSPLIVIFLAGISTLDKIANRKRRYAIMALHRVVGAVVTICMAVVFYYLNVEGNGLIYGGVLGACASMLVALAFSVNYLKNLHYKFAISDLALCAKKYSQFPKFNAPHAFFNSFTANAPVFLIPIFFGGTILGQYALGQRIYNAPIGLIGAAAYNVASQSLAEKQRRKDSLLRAFRRLLSSLVLLALPLIPLAYYATEIITFLFGDEWSQAGVYVQIMSPYLFMILLTAPLAYIPSLYNQQNIALKIEITSTSLKISGLVVGGLLGSIYLMLVIYALIGTLVLVYILFWYYRLLKDTKL